MAAVLSPLGTNPRYHRMRQHDYYHVYCDDMSITVVKDEGRRIGGDTDTINVYLCVMLIASLVDAY